MKYFTISRSPAEHAWMSRSPALFAVLVSTPFSTRYFTISNLHINNAQCIIVSFEQSIALMSAPLFNKYLTQLKLPLLGISKRGVVWSFSMLRSALCSTRY
eukprot:TRINITY_DN885_c0_g4_i4.p1 TRINITY_DN885_c0_g4~~TRINITY_DN885_c0_g4_i4.p1  ORF type:complete len:101 (+),score=2.98 TRINITY_DN885_c0_g4_i4:432-734(+)